ncbi:hypothetical protein [Undibacterium sp. SXout20W]|uniref:hypothetical protein n=1 Tax=Undibacterium sp. SXout20W TaxID=3413051 RepID=UPI003BEF8325
MSLYRVLEVSWIALKRKFHVGFKLAAPAQKDHYFSPEDLLNAFLTPLSITRLNAQLQLQPGILDMTNGIQLLTNFNFGQEIEANANHVFNQLNRYMTSDVPEQFQIHWH